MIYLNLILLDDDNDNLLEYNKDIEQFNLYNKEYNFKPCLCKNLDEAFDTLEKFNIDFAIVDLKLNNGESGNDFINRIISSFQIPTQILTGFPNDIDSSIKLNYFISLDVRGDITTYDILKKFTLLEKSGVSKIFSKGGMLNNTIKKLFWSYLPETLSNCSYEITPDALTRFCANYLKESMTFNSNGEDLPYQPFEFYSIPPIVDSMQCGTIFELDGDNFINLTPACDIAQNKTSNYQIIKLMSFDSLPEIEKVIQKDYSSIDKLESAMRRIIGNNTALKYHCLPPHGKFEGGIINFQMITSMNAKNILENSKIIGNVTSEFLKDITSRLGIYYSRQGQPSLSDLSSIHKILKNKE
ncbi:hypothetical protein MN030_000940 [Clostridium perfringens]